MGRRQRRKKQRGMQRKERMRELTLAPPDMFAPGGDWEAEFLGLATAEAPRQQQTCGSCHEFIEDQDLGRGTCLHPASGVFAPWYDTPSCPFFRRN